MFHLAGVVLVTNSVGNATYAESEQTRRSPGAKCGGCFLNVNNRKQQCCITRAGMTLRLAQLDWTLHVN